MTMRFLSTSLLTLALSTVVGCGELLALLEPPATEESRERRRRGGGEGEGEGEGEPGEGEGEGEPGEGEGEGEGENSGIRGFCEKRVLCADPPGTPEIIDGCVSENTATISTVRGVGDPLCTQLANAFEGFADCVSGQSCAQANNPDDPSCASDSDLIDSLLDQGAGPCLVGDPSVSIPAGWNCPGEFFGVGDGCDCGCGAIDADCGGIGDNIPGSGVGVEGCEFCHDEAGVQREGNAGACLPE